MKSEFDRYQALLDELEPRIREAFVQAVQAVKDKASLREIEAAIARGDADAVADMLNLDAEALAAVEDAIEEVYRQGGHFQATVGAFQPRHDRAIRWVRDAGAALVAEVSSGQREMIKDAITAGVEAGRGANAIGRDIIGVRSRATGKREGGIVGLTEREAGFVANARAELRDDPAAFLRRAARDRRFDRTIAKAVREGKPIAQSDIDRIVRRYSDGLLARRGDRIARTEALGALNAGRFEAMQQQMERLGLDRAEVIATWVSARDGRVRDSHRSLNGDQVKMGQPFQSDSGALLRFPGDRAMGAGPGEVIACRCGVTYDLRRHA